MTDQEKKTPESESQPEIETPTPVEGPVAFPRLGIILIAVLLGLIVILAIIISLL